MGAVCRHLENLGLQLAEFRRLPATQRRISGVSDMDPSASSTSFTPAKPSGIYVPPHRRTTSGSGIAAPVYVAKAKLSDETRLVYDVSLIVEGTPEDDPYALACATLQLALPDSSRAPSVSEGDLRVRRWGAGPSGDEFGPFDKVGRLLEKWNSDSSGRATAGDLRVKAELIPSTAASAKYVRFSGLRAQLVNWLGIFLRQENAHLFVLDAIPEAIRTPRARAAAEHAPLFSSDVICRSECGIEQPDTYADNEGGILQLLMNESALPLHPEVRHGWIINLGRGPRYTFVKKVAGDLLSSDAGVAAELISLAATAARCSILAASAPADAAFGRAVPVSTGLGAAAVSDSEAVHQVLGDTGPLLIVSHLGQWANRDVLHAHLCLEPAVFLRGYFQTAGSLNGTGAKAGLAATDLFFIKTCMQRQLLEHNGEPYYVGLHEHVRKASPYVVSDLRKCSLEHLEAKGVIRLDLAAAAGAAQSALLQARTMGWLAGAVSGEAVALRFLFSRDQARIAVWVACSSDVLDGAGSAVSASAMADKPAAVSGPPSSGPSAVCPQLPQAWAMFAAQQCLLNIYQQIVAARPSTSLGAHLAVRTGAHFSKSSIYYTPDLCGVHLPPSAFLQLPVYTYYAVLAGMREELASPGPLLLQSSVVPTHTEWLDNHNRARATHSVVFVT